MWNFVHSAIVIAWQIPYLSE